MIADRVLPETNVAVKVSPTVKTPDSFVSTNSMRVIVPSFLVVTFETKAVEPELNPVIVRPLKFK